jgi:Type I phosphodiesterase / nucleotide pyrophosphatase
MRFRDYFLSTAAIAAAVLAGGVTLAQADDDSRHSQRRGYKHVLLVSVDGLHAVDLKRWVESHPGGGFAGLADKGVVYPNAYTTAPSDSFPGMLAQVSGATPKGGGLFYDDSYDRTEYPSKAFYASQGLADPGCTGPAGTELTNFEALDKSYDFSTGLVADIAGGGTLGEVATQLDPDHMQRKLVNGQCVPVFPHEYVRTNTIFEVIKAAGMRTAWSDKHPAYENLSGPSGKGLDELFAPEINSQDNLDPGAQPGDDYTTSYTGVRTYDSLKVQAVINWIDGFNGTRTRRQSVPAIFGMNFQAVSVGQKLAKAGNADADKSLKGGYADAEATPGNALTLQLQFVDEALARFVNELKAQNLYDSTLIIVSAKHGQSPINVKDRVAISDGPYSAAPGFGSHGFEICDDVALVWLSPELQQATNPATGHPYYADAKAYIQAHAADLHIQKLLDRDELTRLYEDPFHNSRVPDFIAITDHGAICTGGSKLAEHGGFAGDDRNVALVVSSSRINHPAVVDDTTFTTQIAPTILDALGLDPRSLQAVREEGTQVLK